MGELLDAALGRAFGSGIPIRYIQVGANDGVHEDPLYHHHVSGEFKFEWGQVYEPIPEYFERLAANMRPFPYVTCHELAVDDSDTSGTREFNYVSPSDVEKHRLPPSSLGIGSFSRDRNALGGFRYPDAKFQVIKDHIRTITVATVPMVELTADYGDANLFVTDCEGHDLEIVNAAFKCERFRPKVAQFEYLGLFDELLKSTLARLQSVGYQIARAGKDVICEHQGA